MSNLFFYEATRKMQIGDVFETVDKERFKLLKGGGFSCETEDPVYLTKGMMDFEGKIIPAEPKVLEVAGIVAKVADDIYNHDDKWSGVHAVKVGNLCHQNGRLERDRELRPLIEAISGSTETMEQWYRKVVKEFNKLRPLNSE